MQEVMGQGCSPKQEVCNSVGCEGKRQSSSCIEGCQGKVAVGAACSLINRAIPVIFGIPCSTIPTDLRHVHGRASRHVHPKLHQHRRYRQLYGQDLQMSVYVLTTTHVPGLSKDSPSRQWAIMLYMCDAKAFESASQSKVSEALLDCFSDFKDCLVPLSWFMLRALVTRRLQLCKQQGLSTSASFTGVCAMLGKRCSWYSARTSWPVVLLCRTLSDRHWHGETKGSWARKRPVSTSWVVNI